jgi:hypothetical protein
MPTSMTRPRAGVLLAAGTLLLAVLALAPRADAATIYACIKKKTGTARFVSRTTKCKRGETKISWNSQGPAGTPGTPGAKGETGSKGETGPAATTLWAVVSETGTLARGSGVVGSSEERPGEYAVTFNRNITKCAFMATVGTVSSAVPPARFIGVDYASANPDEVFIETYGFKGENVETPFHLAVFC